MNQKARNWGFRTPTMSLPADWMQQTIIPLPLTLQNSPALRCKTRILPISVPNNMKVKFGDPPYERWLKNYNRLLELYPDCIGVKTGFTDDAGRCLVSAAERDGMTLICVTLNAQDDWSLHAFLYDKCFESYSMTPLPDIPSSITLAGDKLQENGIESELMLKPAYEAFVPLKSGESARLTATVLCEPFAYAPAQPGRVYAQTLFSLDGYPLCSVPMVASS